MTNTEEKNTLIEYSIRAIATIIASIILIAYFFVDGLEVQAEEYSNFMFGAERYHYVNGTEYNYYRDTEWYISGGNIGVVAYKGGGGDGYTEDYISYYVYCIDPTQPIICEGTIKQVFTGTIEREETNTSTYDNVKLVTEQYGENEYTFYYIKSGAIGRNYGETEWGYCNIEVNCPFFENKGCALAYITSGSTDGMISGGYEKEIPDTSEAVYNSGISLMNFEADNVINATWSGLSGIGEDTTNNSFVTVDYGIAPINNPTNISDKSYSYAFAVNDGGFTLLVEDLLEGYTDYFVQYIKVTPYHYNLDETNTRLYVGNSSIVYYDASQTLSGYDAIKNLISDYGGGKKRGTVYLNDFYLEGISTSEYDILGHRKISWTGTTRDADIVLIPDADTLVVASYIVINNDEDYSTTPMLHKTVTIGEKSVIIDYGKLLKESEKNNFTWDCEIRLTPCFIKDGILYIGEQTVVDMGDNTIKNEGINSDGKFVQDDIENKTLVDTNTVTNYTNSFIGFLKTLVSQLGALPSMYATVFSFVPSMYLHPIGMLFTLLLILRILGR